MIEILCICLVLWIIYAWKSGKFKKEYQDKNNVELKQVENNENLLAVSSLSQKKKKLSLKQREKYAEELAKKHGTRTQNPEIAIPHQKISIKNTQNNNIENHNDEFYTPEYEITYQSMGKNITTRDIEFLELTTKDFDSQKFYYIEAFCFEAQELRSFRVNRIIDLYDYQTGIRYFSYSQILNFLIAL